MRNRPFVSVCAAALVLGSSAPATAAVEPAVKCVASKHNAIAKYASSVFGCASKAARASAAIDPACLAKAVESLDGAFAKADTSAGSPCNGEPAASRGSIDDLVESLSAATPGAGDDADCASKKRKAFGKLAAAQFKAAGRNHLSTDAERLAAALQKATDKFTGSYAKAGDCPTDDAAGHASAVGAAVAELSACLVSPTGCTQVEVEVPSGGTGSSDPDSSGATPDDPVTTSIVSPVAGTIRIVETEAASPPPSGYTSLGVHVEISAPAASVADPLVLTFRFDASLLPADTSAVKITRNGVLVLPCTGAPGTADPDPCESARATLGDGDLTLSVLTSHASDWDGVVAGPCTLTGTWQLPGDAGVSLHFVELAGGSIRSLGTSADETDGPVDPIGTPFTRSGSTLDLAGMAGTVNASCDSINFPPISGASPTLVRVATTSCGNGVPEAGEECDDGNWDNLDGCNAFECDGIDSYMSGEFVYECGLCRSSPATCGNAALDAGEGCDDGNLYTGDGCAVDCTFTCGNGAIDPDDNGFGYEHCDDGNRVSGDCCSSTCTVEFAPVCGDGCHVGFSEECDDGNVMDGDGCSSTCTLEP